MTPDLHNEATGLTTTTMTEDTTSKRHHPEQPIKLPMMVSPETTYAAKVEEKSKQGKMTKKEIKKRMENVLKRGDFKMKIGRLMFWDFGGQYVYYTTHQTFMTYRALFLVVFDGSTDLYDEVPDVLCFPGQHGTPTPAGMHCLR
jgi:GTPase SAR1 family protein